MREKQTCCETATQRRKHCGGPNRGDVCEKLFRMMGRETVICVSLQGQEILKGVITVWRYNLNENLTLLHLEQDGRQENVQ